MLALLSCAPYSSASSSLHDVDALVVLSLSLCSRSGPAVHRLPVRLSLGLLPLVHIPEVVAQWARFERLDKAVNTGGAGGWSGEQAAEARELLELAKSLLARSLQHARSPALLDGLRQLEQALTDENVR